MTTIRKKITDNLTSALRAKIEVEVVQEGKEPRQVMRDLDFFLQDFDKEMLKITYNYVKYLEYCKQNEQPTEGAFEQFLTKMDHRFQEDGKDGGTALEADKTLGEEPSFLDSTTTFADADLSQRELDRQKYDEMMSKLHHTQVKVVGEQISAVPADGAKVAEDGVTVADLLEKEQRIVEALTELTDSVHVRNLYNDNMEETFSGLLKAILTSINELSEKYTNLVENVDELNGRLEDSEVKTLNNVARMLKKVTTGEDSTLVSNNLEIDSEQNLVLTKEKGAEALKMNEGQMISTTEVVSGDENFAIGEEVFFEEELWTIVQAAEVANSATNEQEIRLKLRNNVTEEECWVGFEEINR